MSPEQRFRKLVTPINFSGACVTDERILEAFQAFFDIPHPGGFDRMRFLTMLEWIEYRFKKGYSIRNIEDGMLRIMTSQAQCQPSPQCASSADWGCCGFFKRMKDWIRV
jgi:hypothetical protein